MPDVSICPKCGEQADTAGMPDGRLVCCKACSMVFPVGLKLEDMDDQALDAPDLLADTEPDASEASVSDAPAETAPEAQPAAFSEPQEPAPAAPEAPESPSTPTVPYEEVEPPPPPEPAKKPTLAEQEESAALVAQAREALDQAKTSGNHEDYKRALEGFEQALGLMRKNEEAHAGRVEAELAFAEKLLAEGAFDLAERQLRHRTAEHRKLNQRIDEGRRQRDSRILRRRLLIAACVLLVLAALGVALVLLTPDTEAPSKKVDVNVTQPGRRPQPGKPQRGSKQSSKPSRARPKRDPKAAKLQELQRKATKQLRDRRYEKAIATANEALQQAPADWRSHLIRGEAHLNLGDAETALADLEEVVKQRSDWAPAYYSRGIVKMRLGRLEEAIQDYDRAIERDKKMGAAYCNRARASHLQGDHATALAFYNKSLEHAPKHNQAYLGRALVKRDQGDFAAALADLDQAVAKDPKNTAVLKQRAQTRIDLDDFAGALADCDKALALAPADAQAHALKAVAARLLAQEEVAKRALKEATEHGAQAEALQAFVQQNVEAVRLRQKGKELEGQELTKADAFLARAYHRLHEQRFEDAAADFKAALAARPDLGPRVYPTLMQIAERQRDWPAKLEALARWADAAPENPRAQNAYAWELLTSKDETLREPAKALPVARRAVELSESKNPAILDTLGLALFRNGKVEEAVAIQKEAVGLLPASASPANRREFEERLREFENTRENRDKRTD